ncbi:hypothetical protein P4S73_15875 [Paraglaciecola sp. Hal342]
MVGWGFLYEYDYLNTVYANRSTGAVMDLFSEGARNRESFLALVMIYQTSLLRHLKDVIKSTKSTENTQQMQQGG